MHSPRVIGAMLLLSVMDPTPLFTWCQVTSGLKPRLVGRCIIDGPCERFPEKGGRREDNQQGYFLHNAGIGADLCAQRAKDHHKWCGNHPDAPVHTYFERETERREARDTVMDVGYGSFPFVPWMAHPNKLAQPAKRAPTMFSCFESYQIAGGSIWSEGLCTHSEGSGRTWSRAGCTQGEHQSWFRLQALGDISVFFCVRPELTGHEHVVYKLYVGDVTWQSQETNSVDAADICSLAANQGIFWRRSLFGHQNQEGPGDKHQLLVCELPFEADSSGAIDTVAQAETPDAQACCIHDAEEHLYSPHDGSQGSHCLMRWRACLHLCCSKSGSALSQSEATVSDATCARRNDDSGKGHASSIDNAGYLDTIDSISDLITDGFSVAFMRFLPSDVATALELPSAHNASGITHSSARGLVRQVEDVAVGEELREALALQSRFRASGVASELRILPAFGGFEAGWNCSCDDTRHGWAFIARRADCCDAAPRPMFGLSQGAQQLSLVSAWQDPQRFAAREPLPHRGADDTFRARELADDGSIVYAAEALERMAVLDMDRLVRFLCMVRLRRPALLVVSSDVKDHVARLVAGDDCKVLTAPRDKLLHSKTLHRLEAAAMATLTTAAAGNAQHGSMVVLAAGATASTILQKRLCQRIFGAEPAPAASAVRVVMLDLTPVFELLNGVSSDLVGLGSGFSLGVWARESGLDAQALSSRLTKALSVRAKLEVLVATALVEKERDVWNRSALYEDTFRTLARQGYPLPVIVEAVHCWHNGPSFLERYGHVVYTCINDAHYMGNQGVNEARSLLQAMSRVAIPANTMVVKITGRYAMVDRSFFQLVERNIDGVDGVMSVAPHKDLLFTGCFALRAALMQAALQSSDWNTVTYYGVHLEFLVLHNVRTSCESVGENLRGGMRGGSGEGRRASACRLLYVPRLGVAARRADSTAAVVW